MRRGYRLSCYLLKLFVGGYLRVWFRQVRAIIPWVHILSQGCRHHDQHSHKSSHSQVD